MIDKIFKIGLLVLGFGYLAYLFCPITQQSGRYEFHEEDETIFIMDTATADFYTLIEQDKTVWVKTNPKTGNRTSITLKKK
jgi:hypothetical protein